MALLLLLRLRTRTRTPSLTNPSPFHHRLISTSSSGDDDDDYIPKSSMTSYLDKLYGSRPRTSAPPPQQQFSFQNLYNQNVLRKSGQSPDSQLGGQPSFNAIHDRLQQLDRDQPSKIGGTRELPESVFGREMRTRGGDPSSTGMLSRALMGALDKLDKDDKSKKASLQRLDMLKPPKEHLVEKYFHPDNLSSAEKLKIELTKVRDEFKMSESDCGSARVQGTMTRLSDEDLLRFRREQQAAREKRNPAKTLTEVDGSHSGTVSNRPQKKKSKAETPESAKGKNTNQPSMEKFMVKTNPSDAANKGCTSSAPPPSWKTLQKEFEELTSEEVTSLWDSKIDFNALVETNLVFEADRDKIRKIGLKEACQALITKGLEIAAISKMVDLETAGFDGIFSAKQLEEKEKEISKMRATMKLLDIANKVNEKKAADLALENASLKKNVEEMNASHKAKEEEIMKIKAEVDHLTSANSNLKDENSKLHFEISKLKNSVLDQLEVGFAKAKEQILLLNPEISINLAGSDPYARVVDDKLISPDNVEEEEEEEEEKNEEERNEKENAHEKEGEGETQ